MTEREEKTIKRLEYACQMLDNENIKYEIKKKEIGHINLYQDKKVVMSFWAYTGKCYVMSYEYSDNIGIKNTIKLYKKLFGGN